MRTILHVFIPTVMMLISLSCQNKIAFKIKSEELPDEPMHLHLVKDLGLWPTVTIKINGINIKLHVDTGGEGDAISLTKEQIEKINLLKIDKTRSTMNAHGEKRILHYYIAEKVELDGNTFTNCEIMEMPSANDKFDNIGLMGLGFLKYFTIYFNFKNDKMELYPNISSAQINEKNWKLIKLDKNNRCRGYLAGYNNEFTIGFDTGAIYVNGEKGYNWVRVKYGFNHL
ncbi:MAG: retroviral-like aspartic protease family protein [Calditrichaceae bacterium]